MPRSRYCSIIATVLLVSLPLIGTGFTGVSSHVQGQSISLTWEDYLTSDPDNSYLNNQIKQYEATHPGITIKRIGVDYANIESKVLQQAAAHAMPDIVALNNPQVADVAQAGALADMGPFVKAWSALAKYYKSSLSTVMWKGAMYGLPMKHNDLALFYNIKLLKAAGIAHPPVTWAELRTDARKLTHGHTYGFAITAINTVESPWELEPFLWSNGGDLHHVANARGVAALNLWVQLIKDGSMSKNVLNWDGSALGNQFVAGNLGMMVNGPWELPQLTSAKGLQFGISYVPRPRANDPPATPLGGEVWTISSLSSAAKQKAAWDFIKWTQDPARLADFLSVDGELSAYAPANGPIVKRSPWLRVFADELPYSRFQAEDFGPLTPRVFQAVQTAIQDALSFKQTPQQAMQTAQATINALH